MVANQEVELDDFEIKNKGTSSYVEILYNNIIEEKDDYAYGFTIIMIVSDLSQLNQKSTTEVVT